MHVDGLVAPCIAGVHRLDGFAQAVDSVIQRAGVEEARHAEYIARHTIKCGRILQILIGQHF